MAEHLSVYKAFPFERAVVHEGAVMSGTARLSFTTPSAPWSYAFSLPAVWPPQDGSIRQRDGLIQVSLSALQGRVSLLALDAAGATVIDETRVDARDGAIDAHLVCLPLGACHALVVRNGRTDGLPSVGVIEAVTCVDLGPPEGDELRPPDELTLRALDEWWRYYGPVDRTLPERVRSARYSRLDRVKRMPWLEGLEVDIYPNDDLSRALYVSGLYEPQTLLVLGRLLSRGGVFVDVGANAGLFSMMAARWVGRSGRVYSFEPSRREFDRLVAHVTLNALANVVPICEAIGNREGVADLRVAEFPHAGHNTLGPSFAHAGVPTARVESVRTTTIDRFVQEQGVLRLDAIKMDIEGSEYDALTGASDVLNRFRPAVILELSPAALASCGRRPDEVLALLAGARYRVSRVGCAAELIPLARGESAPQSNIIATPVERPLP